jgi:hypothetical protein
MLRNKFLLFAILSSSLSLICCRNDIKDTATQSPAGFRNFHDSIQQIVVRTMLSYRAMTNPQLLEKLVVQGRKQKEPFNSLAFRELKTRKDVNADSILLIIRQSKDGNALLPLLLLRQLHEDVYRQMPAELRAAVLTDALEKTNIFNTWGLPEIYLEDASKAMLECSRSAYPALSRMLSEKRPAAIWGGGQMRREAKKYSYRLCDYALFFLKRMQGDNNFVPPVSVAERDMLIKGLLM